MSGLFETLSRRFSAAPAILPRRRLRFEAGPSGSVSGGFREQDRDRLARPAAAPPPGPHLTETTTPDPAPDLPSDSAPATRGAWPAIPSAAGHATIASPGVMARTPTAPPGRAAPERSALPPQAPPPLPPGIRAPDPGPGPAVAAAPPTPGTTNSDWQHSAMPPVADAGGQAPPRPVATAIEVTRATPARQPPATARSDDDSQTASTTPAETTPAETTGPRIEIRVGRIEVAAAKPAAPATAAPRAAPSAQASRAPRAPGPARPGLRDYLGWKR